MGPNNAERKISPTDLGTVGLIRTGQELQRNLRDARIEIRSTRVEAQRAFEERYGRLATFSLIYSDPDLHRDGSIQYHHGNAPFYVSEASEAYANALVEALNREPKATRGKWLKEFFIDLSSVLQFQLPPNL